MDRELASVGIDRDLIAVVHKGDGATHLRFRANMANDKSL